MQAYRICQCTPESAFHYRCVYDVNRSRSLCCGVLPILMALERTIRCPQPILERQLTTMTCSSGTHPVHVRVVLLMLQPCHSSLLRRLDLLQLLPVYSSVKARPRGPLAEAPYLNCVEKSSLVSSSSHDSSHKCFVPSPPLAASVSSVSQSSFARLVSDRFLYKRETEIGTNHRRGNPQTRHLPLVPRWASALGRAARVVWLRRGPCCLWLRRPWCGVVFWGFVLVEMGFMR